MDALQRSVHIPLPHDVADALYELSRREYRHPRQQAAFLLAEGLRRAGVLEGDQLGGKVESTRGREVAA